MTLYTNRLRGNLRLNSDTVLLGRRCKSTSGEGGKIRWDLEADFDWGPFPRIPNVRKFKITINDYDELFREHGIKKRLPPTLKFEKFVNGDCLRYARYMIQKCRHEKNDRIYWRLVHMLMSRSFVFNMMAVSKCFPRYHRELPLHLVFTWVYGAMSIASKWSDDLKYKRVYIPKANGKLRPLGVPTPVWRLYMTQLAWFLVLRFNDLIPSWQHGFRPGMGTLTAWRVVLKEVISSRYIYEFDLRAFFDTVSPAQVIYLLKQHTQNGFARSTKVGSKRIPAWPVFKQITLMSGTRPEWSESALNEYANMTPEIFEQPSLAARPYARRSNAIPGWSPDPSLSVNPATDLKDKIWWMSPETHLEINKIRAGKEVFKSSRGETAQLSFMDMLPDSDEVGPPSGSRTDQKRWTPEPTGFPQGANISPFLSILTMSCSPPPTFAKLVMYADDGIFYSDRPFSPEEVSSWFKNIGVRLNEDKSGWVRWDGSWKKSLQFLGLNYDGVKDSLMSNTRSGRSIEFDKEGLVLDLELRDLLSSGPSRSVPGLSELLTCKYVLVNGIGETYEFATVREARKAKALAESLGSSCNWKIMRTDQSGEVLTRDIDSLTVWEKVAKSRVFGLLQSRMYSGDWSPDQVAQNFDYEYISNSWGDKRALRALEMLASRFNIRLDFANSTSVAFYDIVTMLRKSRTNKSLKRALRRGDIRLSQVNAWRVKNGFPAFVERSLYLKRYR